MSNAGTASQPASQSGQPTVRQRTQGLFINTGDTPAEPIPGDPGADVGISRTGDDAPGEREDTAAEGGDSQNGVGETSRDDDDAHDGSQDAAPEGGDGLDGASSEAA